MNFQIFQGEPIFFSDTSVFALVLLGYLAPALLISLLLRKHRSWRSDVAERQWRVSPVGLAVGTVAALAVPVFMLGFQFLSRVANQPWFFDASMKGMLLALVMAPIAIVLLNFGRGTQRWLGMLSASLSFFVLYACLLVASY